MKRYITFLVIAAMFVSSCAKELATAGNGARGIAEIAASNASGETKTVLGEDETSVLWDPNGTISVFYNGDGTTLVASPKEKNNVFYNVCRGIKSAFCHCQEGVRKIFRKGNKNEKPAGKVKTRSDGNNHPEVSAPDSVEFLTGNRYCISLLPTIPESGFDTAFVKRTESPSEVVVASLPEAPLPAAPLPAALSLHADDTQYEPIKLPSDDKTIATVPDPSDNRKTATSTVSVPRASVTTKDIIAVDFSSANLCGSFNATGAESASKSVFFLYSDTESTLKGLKTNGTMVESSLSGNEFSSSISDLTYVTKYYYVAAVTFLGQTYYGDIKNFTTKALPQPKLVDLGLSVKWATCNIGAAKPEEYGLYFAWGDVVGQTWDGEKWSGGGFSANPTSEVDSNHNLKPEYDAAHVHLGGNWRMPTKAEQQELIDNCTSTWTNINGVNGTLFTSNKTGYTDKSIFLPAAGYGSSSLSNAGSSGYYWSGAFFGDHSAWYLNFSSAKVITSLSKRYYGQSVRPVSE